MLGKGLYSSRPILFSNEKLLPLDFIFYSTEFSYVKSFAWVLLIAEVADIQDFDID